MGVIWGNTGIYYYGASDYEHRALMAPYLLQWKAMKQCKEAGCTRYDLLGIAPPDAPEDHPWQGISRFKEKFGGEIITYPPERQIILRKLAHAGLRLKRKVMG
jgi:lipid II:glycine glycyltransferase (peptidoglycan interpeptide bridge formation enzyme)